MISTLDIRDRNSTKQHLLHVHENKYYHYVKEVLLYYYGNYVGLTYNAGYRIIVYKVSKFHGKNVFIYKL